MQTAQTAIILTSGGELHGISSVKKVWQVSCMVLWEQYIPKFLFLSQLLPSITAIVNITLS